VPHGYDSSAVAGMHRPLAEADLFPDGPLKRVGRHVEVLTETDSTNAVLLARAGELPDGTVAVAEYQTAGRGRHGRRWVAPRGSSILMSILLLEPEHSPLSLGESVEGAGPAAPPAALLAALAASEAIEACTDCQPGLRWPNDLVVAGRKLGGVLAESTPVAAAPGQPASRAVVVGIGINCFQQRGHLRGELAEKATSLELGSTQPIDRAAIGRHLLARIDDHLVCCAGEVGAWEHVCEAWRSRCDDLGRHVRLQHDGQVSAGTVVDIAANGDLLVQLDQGGRRRFGSATTTRLW
jgi:BirA family biotin operon repressor/biotin-[acetyl-CoA-carboxylase] ligase